MARESMMCDYNSMRNVVDTFDSKKKGMSQKVMGLQNQKSMLHDEVSLLKSQLCHMKEKVAEEMQSKRELENIIMKVGIYLFFKIFVGKIALIENDDGIRKSGDVKCRVED
jgi:hypothetical protein